MQKVEEKRKVSGTVLIAGGVVIAVSAAGIYYLYSRNALITKYLKLVEDYASEYEEFVADGVIDEDEQAQLEIKRWALERLEKEIESKGWMELLVDALKVIGYIILPGAITYKIIDLISKRTPPKGPGSTVCPVCGKDLITNWRLKRHVKRDHPNTQPTASPEAHDAWDAIRDLPRWIQEVIAISTGLGAKFFDYLAGAVEDISLEHWMLIIAVILVCIVVAIFAPELLPIVAACVL